MIQTLFYFCTLIAGYLFWRGILPLRLHWGWKAGLTFLLLCVAYKFHLLYLIGGPPFFAPELPRLVSLVAIWAFVAVLFFFVLLFATDLGRSFYQLYFLFRRRKLPERFRMINNRINLALLIVSLLLATAGVWEGTSAPRVRESVIELPGLPPEAGDIRIAVLSDLHCDWLTGAAEVEQMVSRVNALKPDVVVILGDFVDGSVEVRGGDLRPLSELAAKYGVFGIVGNHEYFSDYEEWIEFLPTLGIRMLLNEHAPLFDGKLVVAGVTDPVAARFGQEVPDIAKALDGIPTEAITVLLSHRPSLAGEAAELGVDLQISGHTHGGLIWGFDRIVARHNAGFVSGVYRVGRMILYVTNGSGVWSGFPVRLGVPPEMALLHLKRP